MQRTLLSRCSPGLIVKAIPASSLSRRTITHTTPRKILMECRASAFNHPGVLMTTEDIQHMQQRVRRKESFTLADKKKLEGRTKIDYTPTPTAVVRKLWKPDPSNIGEPELCMQDAPQAYMQALSYVLYTDDPNDPLFKPNRPQYAKSAINIIAAWCDTCKAFTGDPGYADNRVLDAAWGSCNMTRALELLKYTYPGYAASGIDQKYQIWWRDIVKPALKAPMPWTESPADIQNKTNNWHASRNEALVSMAVFSDNVHANFENQVKEYKRILPLIIRTPQGYVWESYRLDDGGSPPKTTTVHAQFSLGALANTCQIIYNASGGRIDLFGECGNRLAAGHEYVATLLMEDERNKMLAGNRFPEVPQSNDVNSLFTSVKYFTAAWGLAVAAYEERGVPVPKSRKLLDTRPDKDEYPHLEWGWTCLTHRKAQPPVVTTAKVVVS